MKRPVESRSAFHDVTKIFHKSTITKVGKSLRRLNKGVVNVPELFRVVFFSVTEGLSNGSRVPVVMAERIPLA